MGKQKEKLGVFPYVVGGISYIPLIGVPIGIITIIYGLITRKRGGKILALIGAGGIEKILEFKLLVHEQEMLNNTLKAVEGTVIETKL